MEKGKNTVNVPALTVTILGSGTAVPVVDRGQPCLLIQGIRENFVLDTGAGSLRGVSSAGLDPRQVHALLFSHLHIDHIGELPAWLFAFRNPAYGRSLPLHIGGGPGIREHIDALTRTYGDSIVPPVDVAVLNLLEESLPSTEFDVRALVLEHHHSSIGLRITQKGSGLILAYSGDTDYCPQLVELGTGSDLFILECSHPDISPIPGHLHPETALKAAVKSGCKKAVMTHFYPGWDPGGELKVIHGSPYHEDYPEIIIAKDGLTISLWPSPNS